MPAARTAKKTNERESVSPGLAARLCPAISSFCFNSPAVKALSLPAEAGLRPSGENDPVKNSICFFINELVYKTLHEEETNPPLFDFLANTLDILQLSTTNCVNFHLTFMLKYAQYRGFYPSENFSENNSIFDMVEGSFANELPRHAHFLDKEYSALIWRLMNANYENSHQLSINNKQRKQLLLSLIDYYKLHNANTGEITSHLVLEQLF